MVGMFPKIINIVYKCLCSLKATCRLLLSMILIQLQYSWSLQININIYIYTYPWPWFWIRRVGTHLQLLSVFLVRLVQPVDFHWFSTTSPFPFLSSPLLWASAPQTCKNRKNGRAAPRLKPVVSRQSHLWQGKALCLTELGTSCMCIYIMFIGIL